MRPTIIASATACLLAGSLALAPGAGAHATYNLAGYGAGIAGSTTGTDGAPANDASAFTNGPLDGYTGTLPVNWYGGLHTRTATRTIQTGVGPTPAADSLLAEVLDFNLLNDPDFPTDRILAVAGKSWTDPGNDNQGWGQGLDFGLLNLSPIDDLLAGGDLKLTVALAPDPNGPTTPQLAMAIYGGWDTSSTSDRHQTFTTSPTPVDNPLGSAGLVLLDYVVAGAPGDTIALTVPVTDTYGGQYTVFVAALGGVAAQYVLTAANQEATPTTLEECLGVLSSRTAELNTCDDGKDAAEDALEAAEGERDAAVAALAAANADADGDGRRDADDSCPDTASGVGVDQGGCSAEQFCSAIDATTKAGQKLCKKADWRNDEPVMKKSQADCTVEKGSKGSADDRCVPTS